MKKLLIGLLLGMGVVMGVQAEDVGFNIDGKNIVLKKSSKSFGSDEYSLNVKDFPSGIFLKATDVGGNELVNATELIKSRFIEKGFKVVKTLEEADVAIGFYSGGSLDMKSADQQAEHSVLPTGNQLSTGLGGAIGTTIALGPIGAVGYLIGSLLPGETATINGMSFIKPTYTTSWGKKYFKSNTKEGYKRNSADIKYQLDGESKAGDAVVLKLVIDQWINRYMVMDAEPSTSAIDPVSAVAATN